MAISPQREQFNRDLVAERRLPFDVLSDHGNEVARQFGLVFRVPLEVREIYQDFGLDLPTFNGDDSWTLPMPARYVIDQQGIIRAATVNPDYTRRPDPSETIAALKRL